ncbi:DUF1643 domain-containing protein [Paraburkholderia sp. LEh10]|uniref:DUF1643 domain-containing protein n=1 Tax=Paraburkholderia sp. LEh10 TaxID=2821353 RepID=UPI001AE16598|nr:DUF1643 domain-containing protein [Paraburkholderia sp. LEh10]MBP0593727.1 DUF1643 domain-containing protein [Paraburkholderia sp. LEh10]
MQYLTDSRLTGERGCILSDCGAYRYRLWREWDKTRPTIAFLMLNPSTADHLSDDPTITRCMSRAIAGKYGRLEVANLFPLRATDPDELLTHPVPLGPTRGGVTADSAILDTLEQARTIVCAWGAHTAAHVRAAEVMRVIAMAGYGNKLYHLGLNRDGSPKHPLYIAASTRPKLFIIER